MINISELTTKDVGRVVWYTPNFGDTEMGIIKSWNEEWVFVVYPRDNMEVASNFMNYTAAATDPKQLGFG